MQDELLLQKQRNFRATGLVVLIATLGLLIFRILNSHFYAFLTERLSESTAEVLFETVATFAVQVGLMVAAPLIVFKLYGKKSVRQTLEYSNFRRTDWRIIVMSVIIGVCAVVVTLFVVNIWLIILRLMGYSYSPSETYMPESFNVFYMLLMLLLTAVLPGICEEFICRGCLTNAMRNSFSKVSTVIIGGLWFGLFHQYIVQTLYTSLMGMLLVYLLLETKSIWPCIVIHFTNNAVGVIIDFWSTYGFFGVNPSDGMSSFVSSNFLAAIGIVFACAAIIFALVRQIRRVYARKYSKDFVGMMQSGDIDGGMEKMVTPITAADYARYKPTLRDGIFYIGALFVTIANTILTFVSGIF